MQHSASILIKQVEIVDPSSPFHLQIKNILIEDGLISRIDDNINPHSKTVVIDGTGQQVSVGWFDMRTHLCDPGYEHKETIDSGISCAMYGGFTGIACLPETKPVIQSKDTIAYIKNKAKEYLVEVFPMAAVTQDLKGDELTEMIDLHLAGAVAFTDGNHPIAHAGVLTKALQYLQPFDGLIIQHPEEKKLTQYGQMNEGETSTYLGLKGIPVIAEELIISRDIDLLRYAGGKIHFSRISTGKSVDLIRQAKNEKLNVTCDVAVANLIFEDKVLMDFDTNFKVNPPLRTLDDMQALWQGLADGTIDAIVSDHTPQDTESKFLEFDLAEFGMIGLETMFAALMSFKPSSVSLQAIIQAISQNPRQILSLPEISIKEGGKANLTIFDKSCNWVYTKEHIRSLSKNTPFVNQTFTGKATYVLRMNAYQKLT